MLHLSVSRLISIFETQPKLNLIHVYFMQIWLQIFETETADRHFSCINNSSREEPTFINSFPHVKQDVLTDGRRPDQLSYVLFVVKLIISDYNFALSLEYSGMNQKFSVTQNKALYLMHCCKFNQNKANAHEHWKCSLCWENSVVSQKEMVQYEKTSWCFCLFVCLLVVCTGSAVETPQMETAECRRSHVLCRFYKHQKRLLYGQEFLLFLQKFSAGAMDPSTVISAKISRPEPFPRNQGEPETVTSCSQSPLK